MGKIVFLNLFAKELFSGGIATTYNHARILRNAGIDAYVFQYEVPNFLKDTPNIEEIWRGNLGTLTSEDILIFPETLQGRYAELITKEMPCQKIVFCQNPYYFSSYDPTSERLKAWNVKDFLVPSHHTKKILNQIFRIPNENIAYLPPMVDFDLFRLGEVKRRRILCFSWKWNMDGPIPPYGQTIREFFRFSRPDLEDWEWVDVRGKSRLEVAKLLGESCISVTMGRMESCALMPLESMASSTLVCGFQGNGKSDYASAENGFWHSPEDLCGLALSIGEACDMWKRAEQEKFQGKESDKLRQRLAVGQETAERYSSEKLAPHIVETYQKLLAKRA